jgi:hypothetical protein
MKKKIKKSKNKEVKLKTLKWVEPFIRVRIISKKFENGKYYNKKVIVNDILNRK